MPDAARYRFAFIAGAVLLAACSEPRTSPSNPVPASLALISHDPHAGIASYPAADPVIVQVLGADGRPLAGVDVEFRVTSGTGRLEPQALQTDFLGRLRAVWHLGPEAQQAGRAVVRARDDRGPMPAAPEELSVDFQGSGITVPEPAASMLGGLAAHIENSLSRLFAMLPLNQQYASIIEEKVDMLLAPGVGSDIILAMRVAEGVVRPGAADSIPVVGIFPLERMRVEASDVVRRIASTVPALEAFLGPFPHRAIGLWYGFAIGSSGGGGGLNLEDRTTYQSRPGPLPYDAMGGHELGHSYVGNESLTQFLELYVYNVQLTGSDDLKDWVFTRDYPGPNAENQDVHALLDVYQLVGPSSMSAGFRAVLPHRPPYGQPLSEDVIQAFRAAVPSHHAVEVSEKLARIRF